jgi:hypothetical protein
MPSNFYIEAETSLCASSQLALARKTLVICCFLSSSNDMDCLTSVLRITGVTEKDLSLEYDCLALNLHGMIRHTIRLRRKQPSKECPSHIA